MRIRQVRPEFFTDPVTAHLSPVVRLTYIGLWCVADDAGYLVWDVAQIGALLYPYMSVRRRERVVTDAGVVLELAGRIIRYPCDCARIPTLVDHQRIGGNKSFPVRDIHRVHTSTDLSDRNVTVGNGRVGNGTVNAPASTPDGAGATSEFQQRVPRLTALGGKP